MRGDETDVYLLWHPDWLALKVGLCERGNSRISSHERHRWSLVGRLEFDSRAAAKEFERSVKSLWRSKGWGPLPMETAAIRRWNEGPGGITETVSVSDTDGWHGVWSQMIAMGSHARIAFGGVRCPHCGDSDTVLHAYDLPLAPWVPKGFVLTPQPLGKWKALQLPVYGAAYAGWVVISIICSISSALSVIHPYLHGPGWYGYMCALSACMTFALGYSLSRLWHIVSTLRRSRAAKTGRNEALRRWASNWACDRCQQAFALEDPRMIDVETLRASIWQDSGFMVHMRAPKALAVFARALRQ